MGIKLPPAYEHPNKRKRRDVAPNSPTPELLKNKEIPKKNEKKEPLKRRSSEALNAKTDDNEKVILRLVAYPPANGEFDLFDRMIASGITHRQAILALLRRGTDRLCEVPETWGKSSGKASFERQGNPIETNRSVSANLHQQLKTTIDPFGVLTERAFGKIVGEAILAMELEESGNNK